MIPSYKIFRTPKDVALEVLRPTKQARKGGLPIFRPHPLRRSPQQQSRPAAVVLPSISSFSSRCPPPVCSLHHVLFHHRRRQPRWHVLREVGTTATTRQICGDSGRCRLLKAQRAGFELEGRPGGTENAQSERRRGTRIGSRVIRGRGARSVLSGGHARAQVGRVGEDTQQSATAAGEAASTSAPPP